MHVLRAPEPEATVEFLRSELAALRNRRGHLVQILGGCVVDYSGRAASTLDQGERLVLLKPDGTLLVHTATKAKPVNWMPPGANEFTVALEGDEVVLSAARRKPHNEVVQVRFFDVRLCLSAPLRDSEELVLKRTEGDLHRLFYEHPELIEDGLVIHRGEKATRRGPLDLWGLDRDGCRVIVEVKRSKGGIAEATQLWRYVEMERNGRFDAAKNGNGEHAQEGDGAVLPRVRGILVCPGLSEKARQMLEDHGLEHTAIDWDELLAHLEAPRAAGQATLGTFTDGLKTEQVEKTVRTGRRRSG